MTRSAIRVDQRRGPAASERLAAEGLRGVFANIGAQACGLVGPSYAEANR